MQVSFTKRTLSLESIRKRCIALGCILGCMGYAVGVALAPWILIIWFIWFHK